MLERPERLQALLESQPLLASLFNVSVLAVNREGIGVADFPYSEQRIGTNYRERVEAFATALDEARPTVGHAIVGVSTQAPLIPLAVPILDADGRVIGALGGAIDLSVPNFFDDLNTQPYGQTGNYSIVDKGERIVVTSSNPALIMFELPPPGVSPVLDRVLNDEEGTFRYTTVEGIDSLTTTRGLQSADWFVATVSPIDEAFAPIKSAQRQMITLALAITLVVGVLIWWLLRRQLRPMISTVAELEQDAVSDQPLKPLPKTGAAEVDSLIKAFNNLLVELGNREDENKRFKAIAENAVHGIGITDIDGKITYINRFMAEIHGYTAGELIGQNLACLHTDSQLKLVNDSIGQLQKHGYAAPQEIWHHHRDGNEFPMLMTGVVVEEDYGSDRFVAVSAIDITERKRAEEALLESERFINVVLESVPVPVFYKDSAGRYQGFNKAFEKFFGRPRSELLGRSVFDIHPLALAKIYHDKDVELLNTQLPQRYESESLSVEGNLRNVVFHKAPIFDSTGAVTGLVGAIVDITEIKQATAEIHRLAFYDSLTGLPNRRMIQNLLQEAIVASEKSESLGAVMFLDIDNFKFINDARGHQAGDRLLVEIGQRIAGSVRDSDTVARLGGDEFVVMLQNLASDVTEAKSQAYRVAEKIRSRLAARYVIDGLEYYGSASLGIVLFKGRSKSVEALLKQADLAMYTAKDRGRDALCFFDPDMEAVVARRIDLENDLRSALETGQMSLSYQPQVNDKGKVLGAEALLRWQHPVRGPISPAEFIPLAENSDVIVALGRWVMERACRQLADWAGLEGLGELKLSVNVSPREFRQSGFVNQVRELLGENRTDPKKLIIELTEGLLLEDMEDTLEKMRALKKLGIDIALDDFGTGYSSLSYLTQLPLDILKIDRAFVLNLPESPSDAVVSQTIISMATSLNMEVIAEGVETTAQRDFLCSHGCTTFQGFLYSRALSVSDFEEYRASNRRLTHQ
jgi:diguanylate cyclase (GGDEF)-like protein/PAS domain S-box-containing protein